MMGKKIVKIAALAVMAVVSFYMARWFGYKAVVGILLAEAAFALYFGVSRQEQDELLVEETVAAICEAIEEVIAENDSGLSDAVLAKIRAEVEEDEEA